MPDAKCRMSEEQGQNCRKAGYFFNKLFYQILFLPLNSGKLQQSIFTGLFHQEIIGFDVFLCSNFAEVDFPADNNEIPDIRKCQNMVNLIDYPADVLLAFGESVTGNEELTSWLLNNGYAELSALASAIRGSEEAFAWLMSCGYPELAALDSAIDNDAKAYLWLQHNQFPLLAAFADACNLKADAIAWFSDHDLKIFLLLAQKINVFRDNQTFDYHKVHF